MDRFLLLLLALLLALGPLSVVSSQTKPKTKDDKRRPMKIDDLFSLKRISDPRISPDGSMIAYVITNVDLDANKTSSDIWLWTKGADAPKQLTTSGKKDRRPRFSPDGKSILFESNRSGSNQLWLLSLSGGEAKQLTHISTGASNATWAPDGKHIAFVSSVYPEFSNKPFKEADAANKKKEEEKEKSPVKAKVFTKLFFRHWDSYVEDKREHLFVFSISEDKVGEPKNLTPGDRDAVPTSSTFSAGDDFTFSPDSKYLISTATPDRDEAWSTDFNLIRVPVKGGIIETLTASNKAADNCPVFSPDGKKLAYRAQKRAGFEADLWQIMVVDCDASGAFTGKPKSVTAGFDSSPDAPVWSADSNALFFAAEEKGRTPIFRVAVNEGKVEKWLEGNSHGNLSLGKDTLAFTRVSMRFPAEVMMADLESKAVTEVSKANKTLLGKIEMPEPESVTVKGAGDVPMQMWILKPPGFDATKKWPVAYLVHGGPQGAWEDGWSFRWCPQVWAARGYVVALPNPRGSTGFGQKYVDEISGDWGGKCYEDLMKGVDYLETLSYVDKDRIGSAGASFGGYMMNWFAVNTPRFKCLITHCSVWNFESMYATTDELWFDEWEHGGPPWGKDRHSYEKHSPHRLAGNLGKFKTPMLIIHNDLDFRCPIGQGHELFTSLQRQRVPSRFINFPDEGHWVAKPKNSEYWHKEVFAWLEKYVKPGGQ
jgi:dipeptidyl aminopeptidase/acylaminoacyl peptidase